MKISIIKNIFDKEKDKFKNLIIFKLKTIIQFSIFQADSNT